MRRCDVILDTNALWPPPTVISPLSTWLPGLSVWRVPVIVLGKYRMGIAQSRHRTSMRTGCGEWIGVVTVLNIDEETTLHYAAIGLELKRSGKPIPANDLWIAALCRQHSLPLLSRGPPL